MTAINPEAGSTKWSTIAEAEKMPGRKGGVRSLRANLALLKGLPKIDLTNHFLVSIAENKIHTSSKALIKKGLFHNKVAMKVGKDDTDKNQYVILNINSLSKRLGIRKKTLRDAEKMGGVHELVRVKLEELAEDQEKVSGIIKKCQMSLRESDSITLDDSEKRFLKNFVTTHFDDQKLLKMVGKFNQFLGDKEGAAESKEFLDHLTSKIWWDAPDLIKVEDHEKLALTKETLDRFPFGERVFVGRALKRPGNAGKEMRRARTVPWDTLGRYSIAIGDYVYSKKPTPRSSKEVPMIIHGEEGKGEKWVLASVNSLKRLGFSTKEIRMMDKEGTLQEGITTRLKKIEDFDELLFTSSVNIDVVEDFAKEHPDKEVRKILKKAIKENIKIGKRYQREVKQNPDEKTEIKKRYDETAIPLWKQGVRDKLEEVGAMKVRVVET